MTIYTGVADEPGHPVPEPGPNLEVVLPVAAASDNNDKDGEGIAGPTVGKRDQSC